MAASSPEERVELARRAWAAYGAGDLDAVLDLFDPEIEIFSSPELANAGTYRGHDGFARWTAAWNEAWESFEMDITEAVPVGGRHVVVHINQAGRGRGSGVEVTMEVGYVLDVRDGRCVYVGLHPSFESALAAARDREGIEE